jgi:hypothetical protein
MKPKRLVMAGFWLVLVTTFAFSFTISSEPVEAFIWCCQIKIDGVPWLIGEVDTTGLNCGCTPTVSHGCPLQCPMIP